MLHIIFICRYVIGNESMKAGNIILVDMCMVTSIKMFKCFGKMEKYNHTHNVPDLISICVLFFAQIEI
jgi:hypothetical protein